MHDPQPFEARLGAALGRYADQVPTEVDAVAFVRATRVGPVHNLLPWRRTSTLRLALLLGLLIALAIAAAALVGALPSPRTYAGVFMPTGSMVHGRVSHTATLLPDGSVLLVGSHRPFGGVASAERYDPRTETFSDTGQMTAVRLNYAAAPLRDGRVLIVGGYVGAVDHALATAEIYDPSSGTFALTGSMVTARVDSTATLLPNGRVLVLGGAGARDDPQPTLASAEVYDPVSGTFSATGSMSESRAYPSATLLVDGWVLIAGGFGESGALASAELYDPRTGMFTPTGSMTDALTGPATLLEDGRVLVTGGDDPAGGYLASAELYDPRTGTFTPTGSMIDARSGHTATLLQGGHVLVTGGYGTTGDLANQLGDLASAELYDPESGTFTLTSPMGEPRVGHTATLLQDGTVLIAGSMAPNQGRGLVTAEIYR